jgi:amino acid transporter
MATLFFQHLFGTQAGARRAMASLIAFSIFGNLVGKQLLMLVSHSLQLMASRSVITFTAARVKQEIAKEGILPYSLTFATSNTTFFARLFRDPARVESADLSESLEQTPIAALLLHWATSVTMILVTIPAKPTTAYSILVSLYSYTIVVLVGMWVSFGLLLTKLRKDKFHWQTRRRYRPMISPVHAIIYFSVCCFVLIAVFIPPSEGSPYSYKNAGVKWYLVPCIGLSAPLWGLVWYAGLSTYLSFSPYDLLVERFAFWMKDPDNEEEYIQRAEIISHIRQPRAGRWATVTGENFGEDAENGGNGNIDGVAARYRSNAGMHDPSGVGHVGSLIPQNRNVGKVTDGQADGEYEMGRYRGRQDEDTRPV